ncbi:multidrug efflux pump subunit AcrA (membrane-fusion protein) [Clostridium tetanomorphum]|uniref:efflux RND transporter periplasmic adaptor subunit n=1 Tax=Clostridium tetanomorphum TaxID=1553 RepID=UPI0004522050|nr:efflux RND transporter periplasmic adaptor subunit [Clostridium tetanomorphum]KAJ49081.1 RND family efflux transporter MFP subunit [Clostridium tetanomorphum DSM 665]KAJ52951.1 RND family efflux transporter MFP subunit [Clostridium tetanomorphum DSM 665]MBP1864891.1 multidrug efflux pump subunit AcrA (membrane-fusion protein) [Clostridium tetanomorphum]NRS83097.1 multidrug efflux pump subunit AcrA (membrane-fusion protein) [Clostridium tetanomorphum]
MKSNSFNKSKFILIIVIIAIVAGGVVIYNKKNKKLEVKEEIKNVNVKKASIASISTEIEYPSNLESIQEITLSPKVPGKVASVNVDIGDKVSVGQTLFTLDSSELTAQLKQQEAMLNAANVNLAKTSDSGLAQQILTLEQALNKSQISYNDSKDNYNKMQKLYEIGAISKQELDNSKSKYDTSSIDLNTSKNNLALLKEKSGPQSIQVAVAQVEQSQAGVNYIKSQLDNLIIKSPIAGVVSAKNIDIGQIASSPSNSVTIINSSNLIAKINIPDKMVNRIKVGQSVNVKINALEGKKISGIINNISPDVDTKNNSYIVKVKIDNSNGEIKSGMFAKISLPSENKSSILTVPNEAIKIENNVKYLYIVESGKVKKVSISTGISNDKITEITSNLKEGTNIIIDGQNFLSEGEKVNIAK